MEGSSWSTTGLGLGLVHGERLLAEDPLAVDDHTDHRYDDAVLRELARLAQDLGEVRAALSAWQIAVRVPTGSAAGGGGRTGGPPAGLA